MGYAKVTAIIRREALEAVEARLKDAGVSGITVSTVKGWGEYANFFAHDWKVTHARVEVFLPDRETESVVRCIQEAARTGESGDGLVAVLPVKKFVAIRSGESLSEMATETADGAGRQRQSNASNLKYNGPRLSSRVVMWLILMAIACGGAAVVFVSSNHQMHYLAALLAIVLVLCGALGAMAFTKRNEPRIM